MAILSSKKQLQIDGIIEDIKLETGLSFPGDSLLDLSRAKGVEVLEVKLHEVYPTVSGIIDREDESKPKIHLDSSLSRERKNFTLAHELGHYFLHTGVKFRIEGLDYSNSDTIEETEANYFAASLLMPKDILRRRLALGDNTEQLAKYFNVSLAAVQARVRWIAAN